MSDPTPATPEQIELDLPSFTHAERMELQKEFDCDFSDMWDYIAGKFSAGRIDTSVKMLDRNGNVRFADEMIRHAVWVQRRRTDPNAKLEDFDEGGLRLLSEALRRRGPKDPGPTPTKPKLT